MRDRVLVLGSSGFIGKHLRTRLAQAGHEVFCLSRSEIPGSEEGIHRIRGSLEDSALLRELLPQCGTIVHAASLTTPSASAAAPALEVEGNLRALAALLSLAPEFPDRKLLFMSSAGAVYGDMSDRADEGAPLHPRSYYGAGKAAAEAFIHAATCSSSWKAVVLRPSNIYGPGQLLGKGFAIIPTLFSCAADGTVFKIWGDGRNVRDYCYVGDLAELTLSAVRHDAPGRFSVYNAASGQTASVVDLISACEACTQRPINAEFAPVRSVDVPFVSLDTSSVRSAYGWAAQTTLADGLDRTWRWFQDSRAGNSIRFK